MIVCGQRHPGVILVVAVACALLIVQSAGAAQVSVDVSSRGVYANIEFALIIRITNAEEFEMPALPEMPGIVVRGEPNTSESTQITSINGRMTQRRDITLTYPLLVRDEGEFTIASIEVVADGQRFESAPIPIVATSPEAGEEFLAEIDAPESVYIGQPIDMTLRLWIKPFASEEFGVRTSSSDMWSLVQVNDSNWGPFHAAVAQLNTLDPRRRLPAVHEVTLDTPSGGKQTYFEYELKTRQWPQSAGPAAFDSVQVLLAYPMQVTRERDRFGRRELVISNWEPMLRSLDGPQVDVLPPPAQGQPEVFAGAVGAYRFRVQATPTDVSVGDPITLTMEIADQTGGDVQLDLLQPPPLNRVDALTDGFRLPSEPLAGTVAGNVKTFTQTLRATHSAVSEIPSIPFAYFDPELEEYVVVRSDPIAINVAATQTVGASDIEGSDVTQQPQSTQLTEFDGGILANATGGDVLLADQRFRVRWHHWLVFLAPPIVFGIVSLSRRRTMYLRSNAAARRARSARRNALDTLREALRAPAQQQADLVAAALHGYVADRVNGEAQAMVRTDILDWLHQWNMPDDVVRDVETLLLECDALRYGSSANGEGDSIVRRAQSCIEKLERGRRR